MIKKLIIVFLNILTVVSLLAILSFSTVNDSLAKFSESSNVISYYDNTNFDYIVLNLSEEQVTEFENYSSVEKVVPFYSASLKFNQTSPTEYVNVFSTRNKEDYIYTEYCDALLVEKAENEHENGIYISYNYAKQYDLSIGDELTYGSFIFVIDRIYSDMPESKFYIPNFTKYIKTSKVAGAYLSVNNETKFLEEVKDYKPLGLLKSPEDFTDEDAYQTYYEDFMNTNYNDKVVNKLDGRDNAMESYKKANSDLTKNTILTAVIIVVVTAIINVLMIILFKAKRESIDNGNRYVYVTYGLSHLVSLIVNLVGTLVIIAVISNSLSSYISFIDASMKFITIFVAEVLSYVLIFAGMVIYFGRSNSNLKN